MCWALTEGLAGIVDRGRGFDRAEISPRWLAAGIEEVEVEVGYACSGRGIRYQLRVLPDKMVFEIDAAGSEIGCHVLLPPGAEARAVRCSGHEVSFRPVSVEQSRYVDFKSTIARDARFEIMLC